MSDTEARVSPLLGKYLNTMVADLDIRDKGQYLRDLFSKYETAAAYAAGSDSQREAPKEKVKCETTANADGAPVAARPVGVSVSSGNICATCGKPKFDPQTSTIASGSVGKLPEWYCLCDQREAPRPQLGTCREVSFPHEKDKHQWAHNHDPEDGPSVCIGWKAGVPPTPDELKAAWERGRDEAAEMCSNAVHPMLNDYNETERGGNYWLDQAAKGIRALRYSGEPQGKEK